MNNGELVSVPVGACACPHRDDQPPPHPDGDVVYLPPKPSLALGLAVQADINSSLGDGTFLRQRWMVTYVELGPVGWNRVDAKGKPAPYDPKVLVADFDAGLAVAEKADQLYGDTVTRPLVERLRAILPSGPTDDSTSPASGSTPSPSEPSSPPDMAATEPSTP